MGQSVADCKNPPVTTPNAPSASAPARSPSSTFTADRLDAVGRHPERADGGRAALDDVLDAVLVGTLATVVDGLPWTVPMLFARLDDRILLHGSTGAGALRHVAAGSPVAFSVHTVDGLVLAHSTFEHSANYRSAVVRGSMHPLSGDEAWDALNLMSDRLVPGRVAEVRDMTKKELAATLVSILPITDGQWTVKVRTGGPGEPDEPTEAWRGVVPMSTAYGTPEPVSACADLPLPASVQRLVGGSA